MADNQSSTGIRSLRPLSGRSPRAPAGEEQFDVYEIISDLGPDCDDPALVLLALKQGNPQDKYYFVVSGPHPELAAKAIAQAAQSMNRQCTIALGTTFEQDKFPKENMFSLINDRPIADQPVEFKTVSLDDRQRLIREDRYGGRVREFRQIVVGPLHKDNEFYDISSERASDPVLKELLKHIKNKRVAQFQRIDKGADGFAYKTNNAEKSDPAVLARFTHTSATKSHHTTYVEGDVSKIPELLLSAQQKKNPGLEKYIAAYSETAQATWAYLAGDNGATPGPQDMRFGMFTPKGIFPYCVHVSGKSAQGFGLQRFAGQVCDIPVDSPRFEEMAGKINGELDRFDRQVLAELHNGHPEFANLDIGAARRQMHDASLETLNDFARSKGHVGKEFADFKEFFDHPVAAKVSAYGYSAEIETKLLGSSPLVKAITDIAAEQARIPRDDGKSHLNRMTEIFSHYGARAVMYDAIALAASNTAEGSPELASHFKERDGAFNITAPKVEQLRNEKPELFRAFVGGTREQIELTGLVFAEPLQRQAPAVANEASDMVPSFGATPLKRGHDGSTEEKGDRSKRSRQDDESIADRVASRHRDRQRDNSGLGL